MVLSCEPLLRDRGPLMIGPSKGPNKRSQTGRLSSFKIPNLLKSVMKARTSFSRFLIIVVAIASYTITECGYLADAGKERNRKTN